MKKIVFLISGNIRIYEKNLSFLKDLKEIFKDYQITIASSVWDHQDNIKEFKETYNIQFLDQIKEQNWDEKVSKVKFVTWEENLAFKIPNIFHMWYSVSENIKFLTKISNDQNLNFDYVCRFRSDIMCTGKINYLKKELENLKENEILFPSNLSFRGITDLFFIADYKTFLKFKNILDYIDEFIKKERVFHPEYLFYSYVTENNFKIKLAHKFDLALVRFEEAKPTKTVYIPLSDRANIKLAKRKIKFLKLINKIKYFFN
jgi:hypothetical protein